MKFFITDESNITKDNKFDFFVYGGLIVDDTEIKNLAKKLIGIKRGLNIKENRPIKWPNINWNNEGILDANLHSKIKSDILDVVSKSNAKILICLSPQDFYHDINIFGLKIRQSIDRDKYLRAQIYGINSSVSKFNKYLDSINDVGIVLSDTFEQQYTKELTDHCLSLFPDGCYTKLDNVIYPIIQINNEHSEIHQINDVVLGAITCSLREMEKNFIPIIKNNFLGYSESGFDSVINSGINIYPKNIKTQQMREKVEKLKEKFKRLMIQ